MSTTALAQIPFTSGAVQRRDGVQSVSTSNNGLSISKPDQTSADQSPAPIQTPASADKQVQTPQQLNTRPSEQPSTPGQWEHPRMQEILLRQKRTNFDQRNAQTISRSLVAIVALAIAPGLIADWVLPKALIRLIPLHTVWVLYLAQLFFLTRIALAIAPLFRKKDAMEDIPLTPRQRQLLDLPPMSRPATPQEQAAWVTPPRYSRNTTPTSMDSLLVNARGTPLSSRNSPLAGRGHNSTSFSGSGSRRTSDVTGQLRRDSFGTPRSSPQAFNELDGFGLSASKSSRMSVGLNNKWLYDKGKDSPNSADFLGSGWGSGSVFN